MPSLVYETRSGRKQFSLFKKVTSIGSGADNDLSIEDPKLAVVHALVHFDGRNFQLTPVERGRVILINGKRHKRKYALAHNDEISMGETLFTFYLYEEPKRKREDSSEQELVGLRKLYLFSQKLMDNSDINDILNVLMELVVEITHADKGFLILFDGDTAEISLQKILQKETNADPASMISDSIVRKVIENKKPLIVSDALNDRLFSTSKSVIDLKVCSVLCVPLLDQGTLLGLLYLGNDNVVNLFLPHHLDLLTVFAAQAAMIIANALRLDKLKVINKSLSEQVEERRFGELIGSCKAMQDVFMRVKKVASTDVSVLIQGETGTGKELIARELHLRSNRVKKAFVTINCGAIPENLLESELFGHVKGAFTGALYNKPGKFQLANNGTLFLDEIGELPVNLQVKLLRALQERMVQPVGGTRFEKVDIRVIAATNRRLEEEIKTGGFREDLYYRLNVITISLPPLRERENDVELIAKYFIDRFSGEFGSKVRGFSPNAGIALKKYLWPGNIRELENRIKRAMILTEAVMLSAEDIELTSDKLPQILSLAKAKEEYQRNYINEILRLNNGNRTKTARDLGVDPRTIFRHLEKEANETDL